MATLHNDPSRWAHLALQQGGVISRKQLCELGCDRFFVRNQLRADRWQSLGPLVVCTTTGPLTRKQRLWAGFLNAGQPALVGGLTAAESHGLRNWTRDFDCIVVPKSEKLVRISGVAYVETRRDIKAMQSARFRIPTMRIEPAALLFAAYDKSPRTACGLLAACVQQRLTTPDHLLSWLNAMKPLRRAGVFRAALADMSGGAQSVSELDIGRLCGSPDTSVGV